MNKRLEFIFLGIIAIVAALSTLVTIVGFLYNSETMIIESARWLSFSVLILLTKLGDMLLRDTGIGKSKELEVVIKTREDVEAFRKEINKEMDELLKQIEEEENEENMQK